MKYDNGRPQALGQAAQDRAQTAAAADLVRRASQVWLMDEILIAAQDNQPIPTDSIDQLPPWRASLIVHVAVTAGATMEHGTWQELHKAAGEAGGSAQPGWWRTFLGLGLPPRVESQPAPAPSEPARLHLVRTRKDPQT